MINRIVICLSLLLVQTVFGQNSGYFGKKNVFDFSINLQNATFANLRASTNAENKLLKQEGSFLTPTKDRLDWGFRFNYSRTLKRNLAIGVEFGYDYFSVQRNPKRFEYSSGDYYFQKIDVSSLSIMPKIEFTTAGGLLPMGISHQIGFGVRMVKPVEKDYSIAFTENYLLGVPDFLVPIDQTLTQYTTYTSKPIRGYTLMYAINLRSPLTKSLLLNYGLRYTLNFMPKTFESSYYMQQPSDLRLSESELREIVRSRKQFSFIQAFIGLSYAF